MGEIRTCACVRRRATARFFPGAVLQGVAKSHREAPIYTIFNTTSIPKERGKMPIIRDVAIHRGMPHGVGKLSQFPLRWCKLPCLNSHEIDETG